ncbi:MAG: hypothetical protein GF387_00930 [Candidatus Portnoybacteria bacterium]|nr:hypothetical protein [Candidatus Portnoybacteria bacterium]
MYDVVTFGSATRDLFVESKNIKVIQTKESITGKAICLDLGSKIKIDNIFFATGGGGTNSAATFSKQNLKTAYVGRIGSDIGAKEIKEELKRLKVDQYLTTDKEKQTPYSIIIPVSRKGRTILTRRGASHELKKRDIPLKKIKARWFYISGLSGNSAKTLPYIVNFAKKNNIKIALDPSSTQLRGDLAEFKKILSKIDVFKLNQEEAARLTKIPYKKEKKIFKKLDKIVPGIVAITRGSKGVMVSDGQHIYKAGIFKEKKYIDRTGAGDAFGSGFLSALIKTNNIKEAIRLATANGTAVVEEMGAKEGLLTQERFKKEKRWKNLKIKKIKIN